MVTPLNILGVQNVKSLEKVGIKGILALSRDSATHENFQVYSHHYFHIFQNADHSIGYQGWCETAKLTQELAVARARERPLSVALITD